MLEARNKAWFGILESFASLTRSWTVLSNVTEFVSEYISAMEAADEAQQDQATEQYNCARPRKQAHSAALQKVCSGSQ